MLFGVDEELLPKKYPVLDATDDSPRQLLVDGGDNGLALRTFLEELVRGMDGVRKATAGQGFLCAASEGRRWRNIQWLEKSTGTRKKNDWCQ